MPIRAENTVRSRPVAWALAFLAAAPVAQAAGVPTLQAVEVTASTTDLLGVAGSASEGTVSGVQINSRPMLRPAEVVETVPGVVVTQHSGDGKANQYFLRGFNLDHGTDFFTSVLGVPVNMPTHAHGQGYADLNFLIPELVDRVQYRKGPYAAEQGDFSAAGAAYIDYVRRLPAPFVELTAGQGRLGRTLLAGSPELSAGTLLYGLELMHNDGPWVSPEHYRKLNGLLRLSGGQRDNGWSLALMAYQGRWNATDQVPRRAVERGEIDRYGAVDPTDGGRSHRVSLSGEWSRKDGSGWSRASAYAMDYGLRLWSNFTYYLEHPRDGDQFEQADSRRVLGGQAAHTWFGKLAGRDSDTTLGIQTRHDRVQVGLYRTIARTRSDKQAVALDEAGDPLGLAAVPATVREDRVRQTSFAVHADNQTQWLPWLRSIAGLRADFYRFNVDANVAANSGSRSAHQFSPRLGLVLGPWAQTEFYMNYGHGFHSNDARGTTLTVDPNDGQTPARRVDPLVRARGAELGLRSAPAPGLQTALALWRLDLASELLFVGDAGITEASRPSRRAGIEWSAYWRPARGVTVDADVALSRARFADTDPAGDRIPGAVERTVSLGLGFDEGGRWFGGLRLRHFGPRALIEDNSVRSAGTTLVNVRLGHRFHRAVQTTLDVLNLFDRKVADIDYLYASCLPSDQARAGCSLAAPGYTGMTDIHTHPAEPRTVRVTVRMSF